MNYLYTNRRSVGIFGGLLLLILFSCCGIGRAAAQQQGAEQRITLSMRDTAISTSSKTSPNVTSTPSSPARPTSIPTPAFRSTWSTNRSVRCSTGFSPGRRSPSSSTGGWCASLGGRTPPSSASTIAVSGVVRDGSGNPLAGVTVMVAGTYKGVTTDNDGRYALRVDGEASVLQFLYLGYKNVEETVGKRTTIDVAMEEDLKMVDEVVVIGYGTQSRKTLTTSISKIDGDKLYGAPVSTVGDALKGKVAGLRVATNSSLSGEAPCFPDPRRIVDQHGQRPDLYRRRCAARRPERRQPQRHRVDGGVEGRRFWPRSTAHAHRTASSSSRRRRAAPRRDPRSSSTYRWVSRRRPRSGTCSVRASRSR